MTRRSRLIRLFIAALAISIAWGCAGNTGPPKAETGRLDLSSWNFETQGSIGLDGMWEFYWKRLLGPADFSSAPPFLPSAYMGLPGFWNEHNAAGKTFPAQGFATYRLLVRLPKEKPALALKLLDINLAYRLWINGEFKREVGRVGTSRDDTLPHRKAQIVGIPPDSERVEILLQVACFHHRLGGVADTLVLGDKARLVARHGIVSGLILLATGSLLIMGLYHMVLFALRPRERSLLYFGLICLVFSLWQGALHPEKRFLAEVFPALTWQGLFRIEYLVLTLCVPLFILFIHALFPRESHRTALRLSLASSLAFFSLIVSAPTHISVRTVPIFEVIAVASATYMIVVLSRAVGQARDGSLFLLISIAAAALMMVNDILYDSRIIHSFFFSPWAVIILIIFHSFVLSIRFSRAFAAEEKLSEELEEKNIALSRMINLKDEFLANTSHELRTPLAGMIGISEALMAGVGGKLPDLAASNLSLIVNSGRRLSNLVNDVLDYSRLKHRDILLFPAPVNLAAAVDTVLAVSRELARGKPIELRNDIPTGIAHVLADEDRLQQILFNLIGNAVKFTGQGSVTVSARQQREMVEVSVADTGIGIEKKDLETIFESYEQSTPGKTATTGGTGLGLFITKKLVELHNGEIGAESEPGKGAVFRFTLPQTLETPKATPSAMITGAVDAAKAPQASNPSALESALVHFPEQRGREPESGPGLRKGAEGKSAHVLIVDDEPVNLHVVASHLSLENIPIRTAAGGKEALAMVDRGEPPGLILLDIMMPGLNGYEVCRRLRETHPPSALPVIMLTARSRLADLVEGFGAGANDYLTKPFSREELVARVKTQLKLKEAYDALRENFRLKKELALRKQTELDLRFMQRRLSEMLHAVDEALIAVNAAKEISFCSRAFEALTGYQAENLLGNPFLSLVHDPGDRIVRALAGALDGKAPVPGDTDHFNGIRLSRANGKTLEADLLVTPLELEDEPLCLLLLRQPPSPGKGLPPAAMEIIEAFNRSREWFSALEEKIGRLDAGGLKGRREITADVQAIVALFDHLDPNLDDEARMVMKRRLAVKVMNLSLDYWTAAARTSKIELAERSRIWNIYIEKDGYARTQTLDRYLDIRSLPKRPRWKQVCATADFVLTARNDPSPIRDRLEASLSRLREIL